MTSCNKNWSALYSLAQTVWSTVVKFTVMHYVGLMQSRLWCSWVTEVLFIYIWKKSSSLCSADHITACTKVVLSMCHSTTRWSPLNVEISAGFVCLSPPHRSDVHDLPYLIVDKLASLQWCWKISPHLSLSSSGLFSESLKKKKYETLCCFQVSLWVILFYPFWKCSDALV